MILVDANLLLYAYDASSSRHEAARRWWEERLSRAEPVRISWSTLMAFVRIATHVRVFELADPGAACPACGFSAGDWALVHDRTGACDPGSAPLPATRTKLVELARGSIGGVEVSDQMNLARGAPPRFA